MRPTLILQTICFDESDHKDAARLGRDLYEQLTRPCDDPLAHGAGIPVFSAVHPDHVDLDAAETVVLIPVLGKVLHMGEPTKVVNLLNGWHDHLGDGHVLPVFTSKKWRGEEDRLHPKSITTTAKGGDDQLKTLNEIVLAVSRLFGKQAGNDSTLFVSHAKADLVSTKNAAEAIRDHVATDSTGQVFFDTTSLNPGESLADRINEAAGSGVFIAVRGDTYSSRSWCQREILRAKQRGLPILVVEVMTNGEVRSSPMLGNAPSLVWNCRPDLVMSRAMVEWLRAAYFRREAKRVIEFAKLPSNTTILCRPPELLDLAQGPIDAGQSDVAIYPDPQMTAVERNVLQRVNPRLRTITPTTAYARLADRFENAPSSPFEGMQVAMSLSDIPEDVRPTGYTKHHLEDATVHLARCLISAGAAIAYGGDFRRNGFTPLLSDLIFAYNQTAQQRADSLHSYLGTPIKLDDAPDDLQIQAHHLNHGSFREHAMVPRPDKEAHPFGLYFSDMRRVMAEHTSARVAMGGQADPRLEEGGAGYGGRYPGIVEEAWRSLEAGTPLYVVGGFGGATALLADVMEGKDTPTKLRDETWMASEFFAATAKAIDEDPYRKKLRLPRTMDKLAKAIRKLAKPLLESDEAALAWNGLTVEENHYLFRTRDPAAIAGLVLKGLMLVSRAQAVGKLEIELVKGSITQAHDLQAIAIGTFDDIPLGGAGAAIDRALAGGASQARADGVKLFNVKSDDIDAEWLHFASLGNVDDFHDIENRIKNASDTTAQMAIRHGFSKLGLVAFGGSVVEDARTVTASMVSGFADLAGHTTISWFEMDDGRFDELREALQEDERVSLTTRVLNSDLPPKAAVKIAKELFLSVRLEGDELSVTSLPPSGTGVAGTTRTKLDKVTLVKLAHGSGQNGRGTPAMGTLRARGLQLAKRLLGNEAEQLLSHCRDAKIVVVHDVASSQIPFEMLLAEAEQEGKGPVRPATGGGICRRLAVDNIAFDRLVSIPPRAAKLRVLLVVNPTGDLGGTEDEADAVAKVLGQNKDKVELTQLRLADATKEAVLAGLVHADILHYCGHAFFDGPGEEENGLVLNDGNLTLKEVTNSELGVRLAFVNACESARVRGKVTTEATAFAEFFLRAGTEAYLGTYWEVGDSAAAEFAADVYKRLATGNRLDHAVQESRAALFEKGEQDWANYLLYGDGRFQLVQG